VEYLADSAGKPKEWYKLCGSPQSIYKNIREYEEEKSEAVRMTISPRSI
jgi:hypothetical protein